MNTNHVKKIKAFRLFQDFHPNELALSRETKITCHLLVTTPKYAINRQLDSFSKILTHVNVNFDIDIKTAILALLFKIVQSIEQVPLGYFDIELPFKKKKKNFTTEKKKQYTILSTTQKM